jgi:hypothetical protein
MSKTLQQTLSELAFLPPKIKPNITVEQVMVHRVFPVLCRWLC